MVELDHLKPNFVHEFFKIQLIGIITSSRAFWREKVGGCCAPTSSKAFRRERIGGVARPSVVECFGIELGAFHALTEVRVLIVSGLLLNA